jgi:hypothetical protein
MSYELKNEAVINIKVTLDMKKELVNIARGKGLSLSTYCRMVFYELLDKKK